MVSHGIPDFRTRQQEASQTPPGPWVWALLGLAKSRDISGAVVDQTTNECVYITLYNYIIWWWLYLILLLLMLLSHIITVMTYQYTSLESVLHSFKMALSLAAVFAISCLSSQPRPLGQAQSRPPQQPWWHWNILEQPWEPYFVFQTVRTF